jgi:hypothetical protein
LRDFAHHEFSPFEKLKKCEKARILCYFAAFKSKASSEKTFPIGPCRHVGVRPPSTELAKNGLPGIDAARRPNRRGANDSGEKVCISGRGF